VGTPRVAWNALWRHHSRILQPGLHSKASYLSKSARIPRNLSSSSFSVWIRWRSSCCIISSSCWKKMWHAVFSPRWLNKQHAVCSSFVLQSKHKHFWGKRLQFGPAVSNRNAFVGQKFCNYLYEGHTLHGLLPFQQTKVYFKATECIRILTEMITRLYGTFNHSQSVMPKVSLGTMEQQGS